MTLIYFDHCKDLRRMANEGCMVVVLRQESAWKTSACHSGPSGTFCRRPARRRELTTTLQRSAVVLNASKIFTVESWMIGSRASLDLGGVLLGDNSDADFFAFWLLL